MNAAHLLLLIAAVAESVNLRAATSTSATFRRDTYNRIWLGTVQPAHGYVFSGDFVIANGQQLPASWWETCWAWPSGKRGSVEDGIDTITKTKASFGGHGGDRSFDDAATGAANKHGSKDKAIRKIVIMYGHIVDSIAVTYGSAATPVQHGGTGGVSKEILIAANEGIDRVRICAGDFIDNIGFRIKSSAGTFRYVSAGGNGGKFCKTYCPKNEGDILTAINGYEGRFLDALGVYFGKAPKDVCKPKAGSPTGKWVALMDVMKGQTYTVTRSITVGNEQVESKEDQQAYATSLSSTVEASGTYVSASVTMGFDTSQSQTIASSLSNSYSSTEERSTEMSFERNGVLWHYLVEAETTCNDKLSVSLPHFAVTDDRHSPPCCTPTFFKGGESTAQTGHRQCVKGDQATQNALCPNLSSSSRLSSVSCEADRVATSTCSYYKSRFGCPSWLKPYCKSTCCEA